MGEPSIPGQRRRIDQRFLDELAPYLDQAFTTGRPVAVPDLGVAAVPDLALLEAEANGGDCPATLSVTRPDGRTAYIYRFPVR